MILHIVCVRDRAADVFGRPSFVSNIGGAIRSFGDEINRKAPDNVMSEHAEDFDLYEVGTYDDNTGTFETHSPRQIAIGKDLVR